MLIKIREIDEQPEGLRSFGGGMVGGLLLSPFAKILAGVLLTVTLSSAGFGAYKSHQLKNMTIKYLEAQKKSQHVESELAICHSKVEEQNKEIINLQIDAAEDVALVKKTNEQLNNSIKLQEKEIERLKEQSAPETNDEIKNWMLEGINHAFGEKE